MVHGRPGLRLLLRDPHGRLRPPGHSRPLGLAVDLDRAHQQVHAGRLPSGTPQAPQALGHAAI
eukprot:16448483-Heterocapsa_arctica.AAC.1